MCLSRAQVCESPLAQNGRRQQQRLRLHLTTATRRLIWVVINANAATPSGHGGHPLMLQPQTPNRHQPEIDGSGEGAARKIVPFSPCPWGVKSALPPAALTTASFMPPPHAINGTKALRNCWPSDFVVAFISNRNDSEKSCKCIIIIGNNDSEILCKCIIYNKLS